MWWSKWQLVVLDLVFVTLAHVDVYLFVPHLFPATAFSLSLAFLIDPSDPLW